MTIRAPSRAHAVGGGRHGSVRCTGRHWTEARRRLMGHFWGEWEMRSRKQRRLPEDFLNVAFEEEQVFVNGVGRSGNNQNKGGIGLRTSMREARHVKNMFQDSKYLAVAAG